MTRFNLSLTDSDLKLIYYALMNYRHCNIVSPNRIDQLIDDYELEDFS